MWLFVLCRKRFTDSENQQVVKRLIAEVNTLDSKIPLIQVRGINLSLQLMLLFQKWCLWVWLLYLELFSADAARRCSQEVFPIKKWGRDSEKQRKIWA